MRIMAITDEETVLTIAFGRLVGSKTRFKQACPAFVLAGRDYLPRTAFGIQL
jgi:hypothetical protein